MQIHKVHSNLSISRHANCGSQCLLNKSLQSYRCRNASCSLCADRSRRHVLDGINIVKACFARNVLSNPCNNWNVGTSSSLQGSIALHTQTTCKSCLKTSVALQGSIACEQICLKTSPCTMFEMKATA